MASSREWMMLVVIFVSNLLDEVQGYYCNNDKCREDEFCCGENICCVSYKVWELWYFWCGILFCLFLLSLCACFWRHRSRAYWVFRSPVPYSPMAPESDTKYVTSQSGSYVTADDRSSSGEGSFYSSAQAKQPPTWFTAHTGHQEAPPPYTDEDTEQKLNYR